MNSFNNLSLEYLSSRDDSRHIVNSIEIALKSSLGRQYVWVIVEAEEDFDFYKKFFNDKTKVYSASAQNKKGGYIVVEKFVEEIPKSWPDVKILGIRDADYTKYQEEQYQPPQNIFLTQHRDLEMMMLSFSSACKGLERWNTQFPNKIDETLPYAKVLGYLRIYNQERNLSCMFRNAKVSLKSEWNDDLHQMNDDWESSLQEKFENGVKCKLPTFAFDLNDYRSFIQMKDLEQESAYDVCRGHDVLSLLSLMMIKTDAYTTMTITNKMIESSSLIDFKQTTLYSSLRVWEQQLGKIILKS